MNTIKLRNGKRIRFGDNYDAVIAIQQPLRVLRNRLDQEHLDPASRRITLEIEIYGDIEFVDEVP